MRPGGQCGYSNPLYDIIAFDIPKWFATMVVSEGVLQVQVKDNPSGAPELADPNTLGLSVELRPP
jgi:hypothetical protein